MKAKAKLARLHLRIKNMRHDALHKLTTALVRTYCVVAIEDLNPAGIIRNRFIAFAVKDAAFGEFRRQLEYKAAWYGSTIFVAEKWFPPSKRCSDCLQVNNHVRWHVREWTCVRCGATHDRDENAAKNLYLAASSAVKACGAEGSGRQVPLSTKPAAVKQEG